MTDVNLYPVPAEDMITLEYNLNKTGKVRIVLLDIHGREIDLIFSGNQQQSSYIRKFSVQSLHNGVYMLMMQTDDFTQVRKLIVNHK